MKIKHLLILFILLSTVLVTKEYVVAQPINEKGIINAISWDFENSPLSLKANWAFFDNQLVESQQVDQMEMHFTEFPQLWNEMRDSKDGSGYATFALKILVSEKERNLAIKLPQIYSSYTLWINDTIVARNGTVGKTMAETKPQWKPQTIPFKNTRDTIKLVLQIANFHHFKGGVKDNIYLGEEKLMLKIRDTELNANLFESGALAFLGLALIIVFLSMERKIITVYFSLLCLTWAIRALFTNQYTFISFFPDFNWYAMIRIEYITLFLTLVWALLFITKLFPKETHFVFKYLMVILNIIFIVLAAFTKPINFTEFITFYILSCCFILAYCIFIIIRAWSIQREGAYFLFISILIGVVVFVYDIVTYEGLFALHPLALSVGYLAAFYLMAPALLQHLKLMKSGATKSDILTYKDFYDKK